MNLTHIERLREWLRKQSELGLESIHLSLVPQDIMMRMIENIDNPEGFNLALAEANSALARLDPETLAGEIMNILEAAELPDPSLF